jgi:hypothetical protein
MYQIVEKVVEGCARHPFTHPSTMNRLDSALLARTTVELDVVTRLDDIVLVELVLALVGNGVVRNAPDLGKLLANLANGLARNGSWLAVDAEANVGWLTSRCALGLVVHIAVHVLSSSEGYTVIICSTIRLYG